MLVYRFVFNDAVPITEVTLRQKEIARCLNWKRVARSGHRPFSFTLPAFACKRRGEQLIYYAQSQDVASFFFHSDKKMKVLVCKLIAQLVM
jgi:hypothetical protein